MKEFLTQQSAETAKFVKSINDGLDSLASMPCNAGIHSALQEIRHKVEDLRKNLNGFPEAELRSGPCVSPGRFTRSTRSSAEP